MLQVLIVVVLASFSFVQHLNGLHQVALKGRQRRADGRSAEAVGEQAEVGEAALDARLQARRGSTAPQRRAVLGHEVQELLTDLPETKETRHRINVNCVTFPDSTHRETDSIYPRLWNNKGFIFLLLVF